MSKRTRLALTLALATLLGGCGHGMHHHGQGPGPHGMMGPRGAAPITQTPTVGVVDTGDGKYYAYVNQEPLILARKLVEANFDALEKAGLARRGANGQIEGRLVWQLPADSNFSFSATEGKAPGVSLQPGQRQAKAATTECGSDNAKRIGCWVSLETPTEFKYTLRLSSPSTGPIELDPTVIVR